MVTIESNSLGPFGRQENGEYTLEFPIQGDRIIEAAMTLLGQRFLNTIVLDTPQRVRDFFMARLKGFDARVLDMAFLDKEYRVLGYRRLPPWAVKEPAQYKREVVRWALELNASQVVFAHNSLSDDTLVIDKSICNQLKALLLELDVGVFDYLCIQSTTVLSFVEEGYLIAPDEELDLCDIYDAESLRKGGFDVPLGI